VGQKTAKPPFSLGHMGPHLIHSSLHQPHSPFQMASRSNQPFCYNTLSDRLTDRQTHRHTDQLTCRICRSSIPIPLMLLCIDREQHANNPNSIHILLAITAKETAKHFFLKNNKSLITKKSPVTTTNISKLNFVESC